MFQEKKYYNFQTKKSERDVNPFIQKMKRKVIYDYNNIDSPLKQYKNKLKYKYPSLEKHEYKIPINFSVDLKAPIFENSNFYKKKNLNLSISMKNIDIDKENANIKYKRILPSFTIPNRVPLLEQLKKKEEKEIKKLEKKYNIFRKEIKKRGGDTTEKFFKSISKNILKNNRMYIRNMKDSLNYNNESRNSNLFLTDDENYNNIKLLNDVNKKDNKIKTDNYEYSFSNNGREIMLKGVYKLMNKNDSINLVDPKDDRNYQCLIENEKAKDIILSIPNYIKY
jgi:hypothetical protein